ncbi:MAG: M48 family metalloprotease [Pseudohongiella sp.]|nr:M48 family metalloprotease [Pseudohongiella sp.]
MNRTSRMPLVKVISPRAVGMRAMSVVVISGLLMTCSANPVTGRSELAFISQAEEISIGGQHYGPSQQSQGGQLKVDPELTAYVNEVGQRVAAYSPRQLPYEFVVLNNSVPNAWALPGGKIAINRGLLYELKSEAELAAVLGHEVVHSAARHGAQSVERGMLLQGALVVTAVAATVSDNPYAGAIVGGAQVGAQLISQRYGREAERESDLYGTRYMAQAGYDPQGAVELQQTFVRLSEGRAPGWLDGLFASHPPSQERVNNNRQLVSQLRSEGFTAGDAGEQRYRQRTASLMANKPAYDLFDEANKLLREDKIEEAESKLDQAISLMPREARFLGLKGDIALMQRRYGAAIEQYNLAMARDDAYFDYYLGRGMAYSRQGNQARAKSDLEASVKLLPTALAANELGTLALAANDRGSAKQYFQMAAAAPGDMGAQAQANFMRLDIADNPTAYVQAVPVLDRSGRVIVQVTNRAPVPMATVTMELRAVLNGQLTRIPFTARNVPAGRVSQYDSGQVLPANTNMQQIQAQAIVSSATVN